MNYQKYCQDFFGSACYAASLAYIFDEQTRYNFCAMTSDILRGLSQHYIDPDGFVSQPHKYVNCISGCTNYKDVEKVKITSLNDLPDTGLWTVEFNYGMKKHFLVCSKNKVVFDPWENSETVKYGKPTSYRRFI